MLRIAQVIFLAYLLALVPTNARADGCLSSLRIQLFELSANVDGALGRYSRDSLSAADIETQALLRFISAHDLASLQQEDCDQLRNDLPSLISNLAHPLTFGNQREALFHRYMYTFYRLSACKADELRESSALPISELSTPQTVIDQLRTLQRFQSQTFPLSGAGAAWERWRPSYDHLRSSLAAATALLDVVHSTCPCFQTFDSIQPVPWLVVNQIRNIHHHLGRRDDDDPTPEQENARDERLLAQVHVPPPDSATVRPIHAIIEEARAALDRNLHSDRLDFDAVALFTEADATLAQSPLTQDEYARAQSTWSDAMARWRSATQEITDPWERIKAISSLVQTDFFSQEPHDQWSPLSMLAHMGGNDELKSTVLITAISRLGDVLPDGYQLGIETYADGVRPVLWHGASPNTVVYDILSDQLRSSNRAPIHAPAVVLEAFLKRRQLAGDRIASLITESELMVAPSLSDVGNPVAPPTSRSQNPDRSRTPINPLLYWPVSDRLLTSPLLASAQTAVAPPAAGAPTMRAGWMTRVTANVAPPEPPHRVPGAPAQLPSLDDLYAQAAQALQTCSDRCIGADITRIVVQTEAHHTGPPLSQADYNRAWNGYQATLTSIRNDIAHVTDPFLKLTKVVNSLIRDDLHHYYRDRPYVVNALLGEGTNCQGRAELIFGTIRDLGIEPPPGWKYALQVFSDHVQAELWNPRTNQVIDLLTGDHADRVLAPLYHPNLIFYSLLRGDARDSPITENSLLLARPRGRMRNEGPPLENHPSPERQMMAWPSSNNRSGNGPVPLNADNGPIAPLRAHASQPQRRSATPFPDALNRLPSPARPTNHSRVSATDSNRENLSRQNPSASPTPRSTSTQTEGPTESRDSTATTADQAPPVSDPTGTLYAHPTATPPRPSQPQSRPPPTIDFDHPNQSNYYRIDTVLPNTSQFITAQADELRRMLVEQASGDRIDAFAHGIIERVLDMAERELSPSIRAVLDNPLRLRNRLLLPTELEMVTDFKRFCSSLEHQSSDIALYYHRPLRPDATIACNNHSLFRRYDRASQLARNLLNQNPDAMVAFINRASPEATEAFFNLARSNGAATDPAIRRQELAPFFNRVAQMGLGMRAGPRRARSRATSATTPPVPADDDWMSRLHINVISADQISQHARPNADAARADDQPRTPSTRVSRHHPRRIVRPETLLILTIQATTDFLRPEAIRALWSPEMFRWVHTNKQREMRESARSGHVIDPNDLTSLIWQIDPLLVGAIRGGDLVGPCGESQPADALRLTIQSIDLFTTHHLMPADEISRFMGAQRCPYNPFDGAHSTELVVPPGMRTSGYAFVSMSRQPVPEPAPAQEGSAAQQFMDDSYCVAHPDVCRDVTNNVAHWIRETRARLGMRE